MVLDPDTPDHPARSARRLLRRHVPRHRPTSRRTARWRAIRYLPLTALVAAVAVFGFVAPALSTTVHGSVASAAAPAAVRTGAGTWIAGHTAFVGYYRARVGGRWVKVYCVSPNKRTPSHVHLATVARLGSTSTTVTRELAEVLSAHGNAASAHAAESVSQALNYLIGNRAAVTRRARSLSRSVQSLAMRYVAEARRSRGAYTLRLSVSGAPLPGQTSTATLSLRGAGGGRAATVHLTRTANVSAPGSVRTDTAGRASFRYRTLGGGEAHLGASVSGLPPVTLRSSTPSGSTQRMLSWSATTSVHAAAHYEGRTAGFSQRYECSSTCDGHPLATLTACTPGGTYPSRISYRVGRATHRIELPTARSRTCRSWRTTLADGQRVTAYWQFHTPRGWTAGRPAPGWFTVDCPPAPPVAVLVAYDCRTAQLTAALGRQQAGRLVPLHNTSRHRMVLVVGGARSGRFILAPGGIAQPHSFAVDCSAHTSVTVRAGVQRTNGAYNYGAPTTVALP